MGGLAGEDTPSPCPPLPLPLPSPSPARPPPPGLQRGVAEEPARSCAPSRNCPDRFPLLLGPGKLSFSGADARSWRRRRIYMQFFFLPFFSPLLTFVNSLSLIVPSTCRTWWINGTRGDASREGKEERKKGGEARGREGEGSRGKGRGRERRGREGERRKVGEGRRERRKVGEGKGSEATCLWP